MSSPAATEELARAKVNLGLSVLARRGDGYHEIDTVMARVALHDSLVLVLEGGEVRLLLEGGDLPGTLPTGEDNLIVRAARAYLRAANLRAGVTVRLSKRIPVAAGLGGGSSDAAATLRGLARLLPAEVDLAALASTLGSDVPFFLTDLPAALARGRGERLEPLTVPPLELVLAFPGVPVSATDAYAALQSFTPRLKPDALLARLAQGGEPGLVNALQPGVVRAHPVIRQVVRALRSEGLRGALMSGSGSCCLALARNRAAAEDAAARLGSAHPDWTVLATRTG